MMGAGMNGMAGSPAQGNFIQQVSLSAENAGCIGVISYFYIVQIGVFNYTRKYGFCFFSCII